MNMSERCAQHVEIAAQIGALSSCAANGDTFAAPGGFGLGLAASPDQRPASARIEGGGLRARSTPPTPRAKGTPPPLRQELGAAGFAGLGVRGGRANWGMGMDGTEQAQKLRAIARIRSIEELDGYANGVEGEGGAAKRGYFEGEKAAIDARMKQLFAAKAVEARMKGGR